MKKIIDQKIKAITERIRAIREGKGYTQEYLAVKLHISQNAYSKIELGYTKITLERLLQISVILEVEAYQLISTDMAISA
ncbi:hypothetical protein BH09BAC6_BH09BAC6_29000 [soil metagenome]|jgi:transcriptional regulator with XRE-family HTH domain